MFTTRHSPFDFDRLHTLDPSWSNDSTRHLDLDPNFAVPVLEENIDESTEHTHETEEAGGRGYTRRLRVGGEGRERGVAV